MNWLDGIIGFISPEWGARREAWRQSLTEMRNYDAGNYDRGNANWRVLNQSAEFTDRYSRDNVRARARDLERNSDMMNSVIGAYKRNVIGGGYALQAKTGSDKTNEIIQTAWKKWCKWSLPHLNLPHISVSGGQAPYGIAGKGSLPKFSIEWYKNGGIMTQPTAFGINPESGNLMAGGEAGPEAIVPLSQLWEKMTTILKGILAESQNGGAGNALSALVDKVGAAMQGSTQTPISGLLDRLSGGGNEPQPATANGAPINYAPVYNFNGAAPTKDDLVEAERMSQAEFNEMMEQWQRDNDRKRF